MKKSVFCVALAIVLISAPSAFARPGHGTEVKPTQNNGPQTITGPTTRPLANPIVAPATQGGPTTITYDDGVATASPNVGSNCYGNQFDTFQGVTIPQYSVTQLTFFIGALSGSGIFVSVFGAVNGTTAPLFGSPNVIANNGAGAFNTAAVGPYTGMGSFLAGVWYGGGDSGALGSGTVGGQGHHGMLINDIVGTGFQTLPGQNALVRATTAVLPVELMGFSVSDE